MEYQKTQEINNKWLETSIMALKFGGGWRVATSSRLYYGYSLLIFLLYGVYFVLTAIRIYQLQDFDSEAELWYTMWKEKKLIKEQLKEVNIADLVNEVKDDANHVISIINVSLFHAGAFLKTISVMLARKRMEALCVRLERNYHQMEQDMAENISGGKQTCWLDSNQEMAEDISGGKQTCWLDSNQDMAEENSGKNLNDSPKISDDIIRKMRLFNVSMIISVGISGIIWGLTTMAYSSEKSGKADCKRHLPLDLYFPYNWCDSPAYEITSIYLTFDFAFSYYLNIVVDSFFFTLIAHTSGQLQALTTMLVDLKSYLLSSSPMMNFRSTNETVMRENLDSKNCDSGFDNLEEKLREMRQPVFNFCEPHGVSNWSSDFVGTPFTVPTSQHDSRCRDYFLPPNTTHVAGTTSYLPTRLTLPGLLPIFHRDSRYRDYFLPPP
uniref:Odorant receptor n=1 Tax=Timema poppense TaxID=170557 RepID=A0A7R9DEN2_TIMPO|nr:unnamed protein product [Timema poppensis]